MPRTLRDMDHAADTALMQYLDRYFYPQHTTSYRRYNDKEHQLQGIDTICDIGDLKELLIDEKAVSQYINEDLPTFAFEVDFLRSSGELTPGWLFDTGKRTRYYLLSWIRADISNDIPPRERSLHLTADNILSLDTLLVNRKAIINMLRNYGIDREYVEAIAPRIRATGKQGYYEKDNDRPCNFFFSAQLAERPINIVVSKRKLEELACRRFTIVPVTG
ncbi:hypothetical protein [Nemorincola caseinilytica]